VALGRTNPTFRDLLRAIEERWQPYRRGLRRQDQQRFDQLFEDARAHADAAGYLNPDEPLFPIVVAMLLEQQRRIETLQERTERLQKRTEELADHAEMEFETGRTIAPDQARLPAPEDDGSQNRLP
jgi:hypothetical protein